MIASTVFAGCVKSNTKCPFTGSIIIAPDTEVQALKDSLSSWYFQCNTDPSGFYYKIINTGSGAFISNLCSNVSVTYKGTYFSGATF